MASSTSSSVVPAACAISGMVGDRPSSCERVATMVPGCRGGSWTRRPRRPGMGEGPLRPPDEGRDGERRDLEPSPRVEPFDGLEQADARDLDEVVERLAPVAEPTRQVLGEREVGFDQLVAEADVARLLVFDEPRP